MKCHVLVLLFAATSVICDDQINVNNNYRNTSHPGIIVQLLEDNRHLFSLTGILETLLKLLEDLEDAFENPSTAHEIYACGFALNKYIANLKRGNMWALKMIDSSSKIPTGLLNGNFKDLGLYDECVGINAQLAHNYTIHGQHCLIDLMIYLPENLTMQVGEIEKPLRSLLGSNALTLTLGQCWPSDCPAHLIEHLYNEALLPINFFINGSGYNITTTISPKDCHLHSRGEYNTAEWIVLMIMVILLLVSAASTTADLVSLHKLVKTTHVHGGVKLILAFSVTRNIEKLTSTSTSGETMSALNGLKVFSIVWVVLGHRYRYLITIPLANLMDFPDAIKDWTKMVILSATLSVDTFFLISGLLNMYVFCHIRENKNNYSIVELITTYVHRYIRLTPAYGMMIALTATWVYRVGDGPMWDRIMGEASDACKHEWWQNIVYLNNYINPDTYCMMQSWYLAADMQMFWLSPLVIYPLWRWPIVGYIEIIILTAASVASPFLISYYEGIKAPMPLTTDPVEKAKEMDELYLPTHTKTVGYLVGILTGYLLYSFKKGKIKFTMNKIMNTILWLASATCLLYAIFGSYRIFQLDTPYSRIESAFYIGFYKLFWTLGVMWLIISCIMGYGGIVNRILSIKIFGPLGRLTYCIYLTHAAVILYDISSRRLPTYYTDYNQVQVVFGDLFIIIICSTILSILLESPLITIEKLVFIRGGNPRGNTEGSRSPLTQAGPSASNLHTD